VHNELWVLTAGAITNEELPQYASTKERQDLIFFFEFTKMFMEAVYTLHGRERDEESQGMYCQRQ
jgi:hypothetical protein